MKPTFEHLCYSLAGTKCFLIGYNATVKGDSNKSCDVFISHPGTVKRGIVSWLNQALWTAGVRGFLDDIALELGDDADSLMEIECCTAKIVIFLLTPDFFVRKWTLQELHWALCSGAQLYPVFYGITPDDCKSMLESMTNMLQSKGHNPRQAAADVERLFRATGLRSIAVDGYVLSRLPMRMEGGHLAF